MSIVNDADIRWLLSTDKIFPLIHHQYGIPPNWARPPGFVSLCKIILEQQVSLASAKAHFLKLDQYISEFTPAQILTLTDAEMRSCQISRQKAKYLRSLSTAIISDHINLESLPALSEEETRSQLTQIKGIGNWTADIYLMFCLQAKDIFPIGDIAMINAAKELTGLNTREEISSHADKWRPVRSLAAYYLWHHYLKKRGRVAE